MSDESSGVARLGEGFISGTADAGGTTLHYVRGGHGPAMVLIHGFPQDWYEWRLVMPRLAESFTVVAVDLRGVGGSETTEGGYDAAQLADDVHGLARTLELGPVHVVGHDIGGWVAYAYARRHPEATTSVTVIETPVPGIEPWLNLDVPIPLWHGEFHMIPDLPEALVVDRQKVYFRYFFDIGTAVADTIGDDELEHYAQAYGNPAQLRAAFEFYRATPDNMAFNAAERGPIDVPLMLVGGENVFGPVMPELAERLRAEHGWSEVQVEILEKGQHYVVEERPREVAELIIRHASRAGNRDTAS